MEKENSAKERLIDTAAVLFQRQGYASTGINQILKESGVPKGSLYYYFPGGKESLAVAAVLRIRDTIDKKIRLKLDKYDEPLKAYRYLLKDTMEAIKVPGKINLSTVSLIALETSVDSEPLRNACKSANDTWSSTFSEKLLKSGYKKENAKAIGHLIFMLIDAAMINSLTREDIQAFELVDQLLPTLLCWDAEKASKERENYESIGV